MRRISPDDENAYLREKASHREKEIEERNKTEKIILCGAAGLAVYVLSGMTFYGGVSGILVFLGLCIWKGCFF